MKRGKKAQVEISFGMIFSVILIVVFLAFAFYAIKTFIKSQNQLKAENFISEMQKRIKDIWKSSISSEQQEYAVPSSADYVCFIDFSSDAKGENSGFYSEIKNSVDYVNTNFVFYPLGANGFRAADIQHLDIEKTTSGENPLCIKSMNGKVSITFKKDSGEALVTVGKV